MPRFTQEEYNRLLDEHSARSLRLSQTECEDILMKHGASYSQALNGAYIYRYHEGNKGGNRRGSRQEYMKLMDEFDAINKKPRECVRYLKSLGFSYYQSKEAVANYRREKGLIGKKRQGIKRD